MAWKQHWFSFDADLSPLVKDFRAKWAAQGQPVEAALFSRDDDDGQGTILLMSSGAVERIGNIGGLPWEEAPDPTARRWALLAGHPDAPDKLGLELGS